MKKQKKEETKKARKVSISEGFQIPSDQEALLKLDEKGTIEKVQLQEELQWGSIHDNFS